MKDLPLSIHLWSPFLIYFILRIEQHVYMLCLWYWMNGLPQYNTMHHLMVDGCYSIQFPFIVALWLRIKGIISVSISFLNTFLLCIKMNNHPSVLLVDETAESLILEERKRRKVCLSLLLTMQKDLLFIIINILHPWLGFFPSLPYTLNEKEANAPCMRILYCPLGVGIMVADILHCSQETLWWHLKFNTKKFNIIHSYWA